MTVEGSPVRGIADPRNGVFYGVRGEAPDFGGGGVEGYNPLNVGVNGASDDGFGMIGASSNYAGTGGWSLTGIGVYGFSGESGGYYNNFTF